MDGCDKYDKTMMLWDLFTLVVGLSILAALALPGLPGFIKMLIG